MSETDEIHALYLRLLQGWNERKANAMAECFSSEGVMIGFDGSLAEGRTAIEKHLTPIFADHPTAPFVAIVRSMRKIGSAGILRADVGMVPPGGTEINPAANARQTLVAVQKAGQWQVDLFQNTPAALHWDQEESASLSAELNAAFSERGLLPVR
ncbi:SgcJ/EcaC family oxidoreductase [uncultured Nitratireductor sp.]|uniref:SgcJ/EcaC family oxidoreductase n=1 Tax=uncultured Nitratireductor sp. TaxID=520953 RepID=UPI0025D2418B|nr:SgcJ/EcaC family oxidoreductase [uncultured Nitratireductor sp.]